MANEYEGFEELEKENLQKHVEQQHLTKVQTQVTIGG